VHAQPRTLLISPFFDAALPSGGVLYSINVAREWLSRGRRLAVLCSSQSRSLGDLQPYADRRQLTLHPIVTLEQVRFTHHFHDNVGSLTDRVVGEFRPEIVHVHNFQGMLSAVRSVVNSSLPVILTALDLGLLCLNFCLYDGTLTPCEGPSSPGACVKCIGRTLRGVAGRVGPMLPRFVTRRLWPRFVRLDQIKSINDLHAGMQHILRRLDLMVTLSPIVTLKLKEYGARANAIAEVAHSVPAERILRPAKRPSQKLRLAYLGGSEPVKGFHVIAEAARLLPGDLPLEIRVLGGAAMREKVESSPGLARRYLCCRPPLFGPALAREHAQIDAVLVPSLCHENSPYVVLEALANGTAVLASDQAGIRHLIEPDENGRLIAPGDPAAWADAMLEAVEHPEKIRRMQANARFSRTTADFVDDLEQLESRLLADSTCTYPGLITVGAS